MNTDTQPVTFDFYAAGLDLWGNSVDQDKKQRAEGRAGDKGLEACMRCGRGLQPSAAWEVVVVEGGGHLQRADTTADPTDPGFMGTYVIGSECAGKIPAAYKQRAPQQ